MAAHGCAALGGHPRPRLEVADILRLHGQDYRQRYPTTSSQRRVMQAIEECRTAALGGHLDVCERCDYAIASYNSCRNRHCPKCQSTRQRRWIEERQKRILPTHYFHVVFTLPQELKPLTRANRRRIFELLFETAPAALLELGADPKRLGAQLGLTAVLHTWTRDLRFHPHLHCIVTGGGLSPDHERWVAARRRFLFRVEVLSKLFRGKFLDALARAYERGELRLDAKHCAPLALPDAFRRFKAALYRKDWVVYSKPPFGGADAVYRYLGRYTHRVGISNHRLISLDDRGVSFATKGGATATLLPEIFIGRFLQHVLPKGFVKIRHYGLMAAGNATSRLETARRLLLEHARPEQAQTAQASTPTTADHADDNDERPLCPRCKRGRMVRFELDLLPVRKPPLSPVPIDSS